MKTSERRMFDRMVKELRGVRLMLFAWQGTRPAEWGPHIELERDIAEITNILQEVDNGVTRPERESLKRGGE